MLQFNIQLGFLLWSSSNILIFLGNWKKKRTLYGKMVWEANKILNLFSKLSSEFYIDSVPWRKYRGDGKIFLVSKVKLDWKLVLLFIFFYADGLPIYGFLSDQIHWLRSKYTKLVSPKILQRFNTLISNWKLLENFQLQKYLYHWKQHGLKNIRKIKLKEQEKIKKNQMLCVQY